jgi:hypothetical protein
MKTRAYSIGFTIVLILGSLLSVSTSATTFQTDTFIAATDFSNDGQDIIVTNCTLTIDGAHAFNSLQVLNGGAVTHSLNTYGSQQIMFFVSNEQQLMSSTNPATLDNTNIDTSSIVVTDPTGSIFYTEDVDYTVTASNQFVQLELTTNSAIADGGTVFVSYDWDLEFEGFNLMVNNDVQVALGGAIDLSGKGYGGGNGFSTGTGTTQSTNYPFTFNAGGGGGHGGCGGMSSTSARGGAAYDSTTNPGTLGSGGGAGSQAGGSGGGAGELNIGGTLQVDGVILANGLRATNSHAGGGAGGSLLISATTISGVGTISANGGNGETPDGGGGGGGRIAVYFKTNNFTGNISTFGGSGVNYGGAGTIYLQTSANTAGQLFIANNSHRGTNTFFSPLSIGDLSISGGAIAQAQLAAYAVSNLFLGSNSTLVTADNSPLTLTVNDSATIESNAAISADFRSISGAGNGGTCSAGSGGGYGGLGGGAVCGRVRGDIYGSITQPLLAGSPGGGPTTLARGGGLINLTVANALVLDGSISANGAGSTAKANGGGGSGGGILLNVGTLSGSGAISANGGAANNLAGGGGGGGRIAIYFGTNMFTGNILAHGGSGTNAGGAGTVYLQNAPSGLSQLIIDDGGLVGSTALPSPLGSLVSPLTLTISGGAVLTNFDSSVVTLSNLFVGSNSFLVSASVILTITASNTTIQPGGGIALDGVALFGSGSGQTQFSTGGGGGNGGYGGTSFSNALGGFAFGSITAPSNPGGSGGSGSSGIGGAGGGFITLIVPGTLQLDGRVSANGVTGPGLNSGGGAGGSIAISAGTFLGSGAISAVGGNANNLGGGGGGGRIAVIYGTNLFAGTTSAQGGAGANYGGAGTAYLARTSFGQTTRQQLIVDNGGTRGSNTPLSGITGTFDLTVTGGAILSNSTVSSLAFGNLFIGSNSTFIVPSATSQLLLTVSTNATIQSGGALSDDGVSLGGPGPGQTFNLTGGGGGYGGMGGNSLSNALGGNAFSDSFASPSSSGSRGGNGFNSGLGGNGGGALRISVNGTLQLDGKISTDGATAPSINAGGGSGGSVYLTVGKIQGAGLISANGGAGNSSGGGGGGGRIAVSYSTNNSFVGTFSAHGGAGGNFGGAGTIYFGSSIQYFPPTGRAAQLTLDNGGVRGANTPIFSYLTEFPFDLNITNGATLVDTNGSFFTTRFFTIGSNSTYVPYFQGKTVSVQSNLIVFAGGRINGDGLSSSGGNPGLSLNLTGGGGGHGGYGGSSISNSPGGGVSSESFSQPNLPGSRGGAGFNQGAGGNGGGVVLFSIGRTLQVDGTITANGVAGVPDSGAGSGGSIQLSTTTFAGAGTISANGGSADSVGGGGGGGRIAITFRTNSFAGTLSARGGAGAHYGGAGTIYTSGNPGILPPAPGAPTPPQLVIDNGGIRGSNTLVSTSINGANLVVGSGAAVILGAQQMNWGALTISSNASVGVSGSGAFVVNITGNATIQPGGTIRLDGQGFTANTGPGFGVGQYNSNIGSGSGAGHGGYGSAGMITSGGLSYDSISTPSQSGSGGGSSSPTNGSAGGGAMHLLVGGTLTVNGSITANGIDGIPSGAGGGSGGALWLNAGTLSGSGAISAIGGDGEFFGGGGGGGGGRIATYFNSNQFTGTFSAEGGEGFLASGGAGTIYLKTNSISTAAVILDNSGNPGTNTPLDSLIGGATSPVNLSVANGAVAYTTISSLPLVFQNLSIGNGGEFAAKPRAPLSISVLGNATLDSGGAIAADFLGHDDIATGPGTGGVDFVGDGSGGGYGGLGGMSAGGAPGGFTYGSSNQPVDFGSAGGISPTLVGFSQGGGAIRLTVNGSFTVNGKITANGADALVDGSGGGSGGSIWITAQGLYGSGSITANGGAGESSEGGGGGGGRIAIYASSNFFGGGSVTASGGAGGFAPGQDGTIYFGTNLVVSGIVTDTEGNAVPDVSLAATGVGGATSDANGLYSIPVPLFWSGTLSPSGAGTIIPSSQSYSALSTNAPDQNFVVALPSTFLLSCGLCDGTNMNMSWYGISGASYQPLCSSNLVDWSPYGDPIPGTNGPAAISVPVTDASQMFFQLYISY